MPIHGPDVPFWIHHSEVFSGLMLWSIFQTYLPQALQHPPHVLLASPVVINGLQPLLLGMSVLADGRAFFGSARRLNAKRTPVLSLIHRLCRMICVREGWALRLMILSESEKAEPAVDG